MATREEKIEEFHKHLKYREHILEFAGPKMNVTEEATYRSSSAPTGQRRELEVTYTKRWMAMRECAHTFRDNEIPEIPCIGEAGGISGI